jgi:hypothetical protein
MRHMMPTTSRALLLSAFLMLHWPGDGTGQVGELDGPPLLRIGALAEPEEEVFGSIATVRAGPDGSLLVLDKMAGEVRWFGSEGSILGRAGRMGAGPGEFREPVEMVVGPHGLVHVLDPPNLRISTFRAAAHGLEHVKDVRTPPASSFCVVNDRIFILLPGPSGFLHEMDPAGEIKRTFGTPQRPRDSGVRALPEDLQTYLLNRGHLLCDSRRDLVLFLSERLPWVVAYSTAGHMLWSTELQGYNVVRWETSGGRIRMAADPATGTAHTGVSIAESTDGILIVLHEGSLSDPDGSHELRVLDPSNGHELRRGPLPFVITDSAAGRLYGYGKVPFPQVFVYGSAGG